MSKDKDLREKGAVSGGANPAERVAERAKSHRERTLTPGAFFESFSNASGDWTRCNGCGEMIARAAFRESCPGKAVSPKAPTPTEDR